MSSTHSFEIGRQDGTVVGGSGATFAHICRSVFGRRKFKSPGEPRAVNYGSWLYRTFRHPISPEDCPRPCATNCSSISIPTELGLQILILYSTVQLLATAVLTTVSFYSDSYRNWIQSSQWMVWVSVCLKLSYQKCV